MNFASGFRRRPGGRWSIAMQLATQGASCVEMHGDIVDMMMMSPLHRSLGATIKKAAALVLLAAALTSCTGADAGGSGSSRPETSANPTGEWDPHPGPDPYDIHPHHTWQ
jgi:hypothetical protein